MWKWDRFLGRFSGKNLAKVSAKSSAGVVIAAAALFTLVACSGGGSDGASGEAGGGSGGGASGADTQAQGQEASGQEQETGQQETREQVQEQEPGDASGGGDGGDNDNGGTDGGGANSEAVSEATSEATPLSFETDIGISIDGKWFPIWQDAAPLLLVLGDDYELFSAPSCVFDTGDDKEFAYDGCYVFTNPVDGKDIWFSFYLDSDVYSTARGIKVGDSLADVIAAYGDGYYWEGDTVLTYSVSGVEGDISSPCVQFTIIDQTVTAIEIYYPTNTT